MNHDAKPIFPFVPRILILGCPGSGKSVFARKLAELTALPLYYLDMIWHKADRTTVGRTEFDAALEKLLALPTWIIDGNYQRTLPQRLARAGCVFLFDLPLEECLLGAQQRVGQKRPDMPWIEKEFDPEFREWIINFRRDRLPGILRLLRVFPGRVIVFKSRRMVGEFLTNDNNFLANG